MAFYVDDVKVGGIKDLCEALRISINEVPFRKRQKEFEMNMDRDERGNPKRDRDGNYIMKRKIAGVPSFSVFVQGKAEVRVRLATTQRKDKDQQFTYTPTLITMDPGEDGSIAINDEQEFTFWYLHPWNKHSPFYQKGNPYYFEYKDNDQRSKTENEWEEARVDAISTIVGRNSFTINRLRTIAKGMNVAGVDDMSDELLRKILRDIASADPVSFINKVDSREIVFGGKVQDAIDRKVIVLSNLNGMNRWYLGQKEICPVAYGTDAITVLKDELSANYHLYADELEKALSGVVVASNLSNPAMDKYFEDARTEQPEQPVSTGAHYTDDLPALTDEQKGYLKKMDEEDWFNVKIKNLSEMDLNDPKLHHARKKSYEDNKAAVDAYRLSQQLLQAV